MPGKVLVATLLGACLVLGFAARAQDAKESEATPATPQVVVTERECRYLARHRAAADVEYKPGVDVRGRPVAPADLGGSPRLAIPDRIVIDVPINIFERLGRTAPKGLGDTATQLGQIVLEGNRLTFNGEPLSDPALDAVAAACREQLGR